jgi:cytochrome c oxidase assembly protein subunit 15
MLWFIRFGWLTVIAIYLLILVGGIVRSTGAGMGCPDWPKCFGQWVPPTDVSELPDDYEARFVAMRQQKNERIAKMIHQLGFSELAYKIAHDETVYQTEPFNAIKTWIEYVNRLIGVLIGILVVLTFIFSLRFFKTKPAVTWSSFAAVIIIIFQGWLGSIVVSTNLLPFTITLHMILAIVVVGVLIYTVSKAQQSFFEVGLIRSKGSIQRLIWINIIFMTLQIVLGTQVREHIDTLNKSGILRQNWVDNLDLTFYVHRSFSLLIAATQIALLYLISKYVKNNPYLSKSAFVLLAIIVVEITSGAIMAYFEVPAFLQPLHLLLGTLSVGILFFKWLAVRFHGVA